MRKVGRNEPCPCGSGKKYKRCCWNRRFDWLVDDEGNIHREVPIDDPELRELLEESLNEFREEFGREPEPDELIFQHLGHPEYVEARMVNVLKEANIDLSFIYAFEKTGRILTESNKDKLTDAELQQWEAAVDEYHDRVSRGDIPSI